MAVRASNVLTVSVESIEDVPGTTGFYREPSAEAVTAFIHNLEGQFAHSDAKSDPDSPEADTFIPAVVLPADYVAPHTPFEQDREALAHNLSLQAMASGAESFAGQRVLKNASGEGSNAGVEEKRETTNQLLLQQNLLNYNTQVNALIHDMMERARVLAAEAAAQKLLADQYYNAMDANDNFITAANGILENYKQTNRMDRAGAMDILNTRGAGFLPGATDAEIKKALEEQRLAAVQENIDHVDKYYEHDRKQQEAQTAADQITRAAEEMKEQMDQIEASGSSEQEREALRRGIYEKNSMSSLDRLHGLEGMKTTELDQEIDDAILAGMDVNAIREAAASTVSSNTDALFGGETNATAAGVQTAQNYTVNAPRGLGM